jgi:Tol biopolymer transport system component
LNTCPSLAHPTPTRLRAIFLALALPLSLPAFAEIPGIELVDRTTLPAYIDSNGTSTGPLATSADGRYTLFQSAASNLVSGDSNGVADLFLHDANSNALERVNVASDGSQADSEVSDVFRYPGGGGISADGRYITFASTATNLVADATGGYQQVYRRDRVTGVTSLISRGTDGLAAVQYVAAGASTPDGRYTLLATAAANFPDANGQLQVYRHDANDGSLVRVTVSIDGQPANAEQDNLEISDDGRFVLFSSRADNFVAGGSPSTLDLFLRDLQAGTTQQVTVTDSGAPAPFPPSSSIADSGIHLLSGDGRYAAFSTNTSLTAADTDSAFDIYRFDRLSGTTTLISSAVGGVVPQPINRVPSISADGSRVLFASLPSNPLDPVQLLVRDMTAGTLTQLAFPQQRFSVDFSLALSRDGLQVYINTRDLPPRNEFSHLYRFDTGTAVLTRLSTAPAASVAAYASGHSDIYTQPSPSANGNLIAFASTADNLVTGDTNGVKDVFVRDRSGATTTRISRHADGAQSICASTTPALTPDARYVVFASCGALVAPASGEQYEIYRYDRSGGTLQLVSISAAGDTANSSSREPQISDDGRYIAFTSCATNLVAGVAGALCQIYLRDMDTGVTQLASRSSAGQPASTGFSYAPFISGDGRFVGYTSYAGNLVAGDTNNNADAFVFDRVAATTERISVSASGAQGLGISNFRGFDHSGNLALFQSSSSNFPPFVQDGARRTYLRDRGAATTTLLAIPVDANATATDATISPDGRFIALINYSASSGASPFDDSRKDKLYVLDRNDGQYRALTWFTRQTADSLTRVPRFSANGSWIAFTSTRDDLTGDDGNGMFTNIFITRTSETLFADGFD